STLVSQIQPGLCGTTEAEKASATDRWFLDEMVVVIAKRKSYLWRAVDSEGEVLDFLVQRRRDT
ncbi:MAG: DDE-type integrase/transposase/recombinase, partial [Geminicoccales bacterium]